MLGALFGPAGLRAQQAAGGSVRGVVYDADFDAPLPAANVTAVEAGRRVQSGDQGQYVIEGLPPGRYTLLFEKDGYVRQVRADVIVVSGQLTDLDAALSGEFTEMDEFVVEEVLGFTAGSEGSLLALKLEAPNLLDSIGSDLMSRAGAGDAASALKLVSGATVQDGKYAVVRGLPDRYVSSQLNGVRLPTADEDKRAVELDQFPSAVIESLQVSKTFTPDQQGDASGGAVDVRLRGVPEETTFSFSAQSTYNTNVTGRDDFLTYRGGGVGTWGHRSASNPSAYAAAGTITDDAPIDMKFGLSGGGKRQISDDVRIGGFLSFFYERDSSYFTNGRDDSYWVENPGDPMTPQYARGTPDSGDFRTALFDITQGQQSVQWGALGTFGIESENHSLLATLLYSRTAEDTATLATDTRGKEFYFPGYTIRDPTAPGNTPATRLDAPYIRTETLEFTKRTTGSMQLAGRHLVPMGGFGLGPFQFDEPTLRWTLSQSHANLDQPDKRQFGALWLAPSFNPGFPPFVPPFTAPAVWLPYPPAANINLGNFQRIWKKIDEASNQASLDLTFPFEQWDELEGYVKFGVFDDQVDRTFDQDTFTNQPNPTTPPPYEAGWDQPWSDVFNPEDYDIVQSTYDVDYRGKIGIFAWYGMLDLPVTSSIDVITGARVESTRISVVNFPGDDAFYFPPGAGAPVDLTVGSAADIDSQQRDILPSLALNWTPVESVTVRSSVSRTLARQTFKELTPIIQQEFAGGPIFVGNPDLQTSSLDNYDLRVDWRPYEGGLVSASWFRKDVEDPIEYVQRPLDFTFTFPTNYPDGRIYGLELEFRQDLGRLVDGLDGFGVGMNGTYIDSQVTLPDDEAAVFSSPLVQAPMPTRDMTNAPEYLLNLYGTYDIDSTGTQLSLFYTVQGDTLVAGAGEDSGNFVPNVYAREYDTLNMSISQKLGRFFKLQFAAKNLTNPQIKEVYRSKYIGDDVLKTSYTRGIEYSLTLGATFTF